MSKRFLYIEPLMSLSARARHFSFVMRLIIVALAAVLSALVAFRTEAQQPIPIPPHPPQPGDLKPPGKVTILVAHAFPAQTQARRGFSILAWTEDFSEVRFIQRAVYCASLQYIA